VEDLPGRVSHLRKNAAGDRQMVKLYQQQFGEEYARSQYEDKIFCSKYAMKLRGLLVKKDGHWSSSLSGEKMGGHAGAGISGEGHKTETESGKKVNSSKSVQKDLEEVKRRAQTMSGESNMEAAKNFLSEHLGTSKFSKSLVKTHAGSKEAEKTNAPPVKTGISNLEQHRAALEAVDISTPGRHTTHVVGTVEFDMDEDDANSPMTADQKSKMKKITSLLGRKTMPSKVSRESASPGLAKFKRLTEKAVKVEE